MTAFPTLRRIPTWAIGFTYLALIPLFALLYRGIWEDFYQSTARYERATQVLDFEGRGELQKFLKPWFQAYTTDAFRLKHLEVVGVALAASQVSFVSPVVFEINSDKLRKGRDLRRELWDLGAQVDYSFEERGLVSVVTFFPEWTLDLSNGEFEVKHIPFIVYQGGDPERDQAGETVAAALLPLVAEKFRLTEIRQETGLDATVSGRIRIPGNLEHALYSFGRASEGFPGPERGSFVRFFYFSAVTITTLGFGDIVPMTDRARLLVAIEVILGVVLAGVFLNSIAGGGKSAPNPGLPADA